MRYEELGEAHYKIIPTERGAEISIPARKSWFVIPFLSFWICAWTVGGIAAMTALAADFNLFLVFWLGGWAVGWVFAAATLSWQITGSETIALRGADLEIGWTMWGLSSAKLYRGSEIRGLSANAATMFPFGNMRLDYAPIFGRQYGSVKFSYGARTVYVGQGIDEAEGAAIVAELKQRLPLSATA
jgi:hypothetical protein